MASGNAFEVQDIVGGRLELKEVAAASASINRRPSWPTKQVGSSYEVAVSSSGT
jgi:hypothetical protein